EGRANMRQARRTGQGASAEYRPQQTGDRFLSHLRNLAHRYDASTVDQKSAATKSRTGGVGTWYTFVREVEPPPGRGVEINPIRGFSRISFRPEKEICVQRHSDRLTEFSHRLAQIKFIIL